jgi:hypothetical protein
LDADPQAQGVKIARRITLSLSRYVKGHSARQIGLRLFPVTPDQLPSVEQAQDLQKQRAQARAEHDREQARDEIAEMAAGRRQSAQAELSAKQQARRAELAGKAQDLRMRQAAERLSLHAAQRTESETPLFRLRRAVADFIGVAVGTLIAERPPHRTVRATCSHTAPTSGA